MQHTKEQLAIFDAVKNSTDNIAVKATAGAGKTTTILECLRYVPSNEKTTFLSFSNTIVNELKTRCPSHIKPSTLHSLGFSYIRSCNRGWEFKIEENKYFSYAVNRLKELRGDKGMTKKDFRMAFLIQDICAYARQTLTPFIAEDLTDMCAYYNIDFEPKSIQLAIELLDTYAKKVQKFMDFVDMIYWPAVMKELVVWKYKNVFLDEAQDTNAAQLQLVENIIGKGGRLISVGDDNQCIYGFSGADVDAFKRIRERPNTRTFPLSITWRCPKSHVASVHEFVGDDIQAAEHAKDGVMGEAQWKDIREGDIVLCRYTKPLIALFFSLIDKGIKATVLGKDFERGLLNLLEDLTEPNQTWEGLKYKMDLERDKRLQSLLEDGVKHPEHHWKFVSFVEKINVLKIVQKRCTLPSQLEGRIKEIFHEDKKAARLMTVHRAKGLENERIFIIQRDNGEVLMPSKWAKQQWEHIQEKNLRFVSQTRSKNEMYFVNLTDV